VRDEQEITKTVLLGITGGVAAYKAAELARLFVKAGYDVQTVMTESAGEFITPLTMRAVTGRPVYNSLYDPAYKTATGHIDLAREPDLAVVAPATANILGKLASGIADDLLSTVLLAIDLSRCPVILAPSMNTTMLENPAVQDNLKRLADRGYFIVEPGEGDLACLEVGKGRMVEPRHLLEKAREIISSKKNLSGYTLLVTAGPTRESLDPVRFFSNHSSGKMGYALARATQERGGRVILISGPTNLDPPAGVDFIPVTSAQEMFQAVMDNLPEANIVIKAAAVADYRPENIQDQKMKKGDELLLRLVRNPDILKEIGMRKGSCFLVGFAAETQQLIDNARQKIESKNLDMIVANDLGQEGAGFQAETNLVTLLDKDGGQEQVPLMSKYRLAHYILDHILERMNRQQTVE